MASILKNNSWNNIIVIFEFIDPEDIDTRINFLLYTPYSGHGHDEQNAIIGRQICSQYVNRDVLTSLLLHVPVT